MVLSKKIAVKSTGIHGYCWFAAEDIKQGEMIWELGNQVYHDITVDKKTLNSWPAEKREAWMALAYQVGPDAWKGSDPEREIPQEEKNEYYVNHSCDGNAWYENDDLLVAMRDIKAGEEIAYDYALTESDPSWLLAPQCLCGTKVCRGRVTGNDWKLPQLQTKYGNHFTAHIQQLIQTQKKEQQDK